MSNLHLKCYCSVKFQSRTGRREGALDPPAEQGRETLSTPTPPALLYLSFPPVLLLTTYYVPCSTGVPACTNCPDQQEGGQYEDAVDTTDCLCLGTNKLAPGSEALFGKKK